MSEDHPAETADLATLKKASASGVVISVASQSVKLLTQIAFQVAIARLLVPEDFGIVALAYPFLNISQAFADLGLSQRIIQIRRLEDKKINAFFLAIVLVSIIEAIALICASFAVDVLAPDGRLGTLILILAGQIPFSALGIVPLALLARRLRFQALAAVEIASLLSGSVVSVILALLGAGYLSIAIGPFIGVLVSTSIAAALCGWTPSLKQVDRRIHNDLRFGSSLVGTNISNLLSTSADNWIIGIASGETALGLYDRSYKLVVQPISQISVPVGRVVSPTLSRLTSDPKNYQELFFVSLQLIMLTTMPFLLVCIAFPSQVVTLVLGQKWSSAAPIFAWLCVGGLASTLYSSCSWLFVSQGRGQDMFKFLTLASLVNVCSFILGSLWGPVAIAASSGLTFALIQTPLVVFGATRSGPVKIEMILRRLSPLLFATAAGATLLTFVLNDWVRLGTLGLGPSFLASYTIFVLVFVCNSEGRRMVSRIRRFATAVQPPIWLLRLRRT